MTDTPGGVPAEPTPPSLPLPEPAPRPTQQQPMFPALPPQPQRTPQAPYDRRSVTALILVGTLVLAPVSVWLGVRGIRNTAGGVRQGRWCAIAAVVGGSLATVLVVVALVVAGGIRDKTDKESDVATGDCVDQLYIDTNDLSGFDARPCDEPHEAEVAYRGTLPSTQFADYDTATAAQLCMPLLAEPYRRPARTGRLFVSLVVLGDPKAPDPDDEVLCLLMRDDFGPMTAPIPSPS